MEKKEKTQWIAVALYGGKPSGRLPHTLSDTRKECQEKAQAHRPATSYKIIKW